MLDTTDFLWTGIFVFPGAGPFLFALFRRSQQRGATVLSSSTACFIFFRTSMALFLFSVIYPMASHGMGPWTLGVDMFATELD